MSALSVSNGRYWVVANGNKESNTALRTKLSVDFEATHGAAPKYAEAMVAQDAERFQRQMLSVLGRIDYHLSEVNSGVNALAAKLRGSDQVTIVFFGDGAAAANPPRASANEAGLIPVLRSDR